MKNKKINKKLSFKKETVSNLENDAMAGIKGGWWTVRYTYRRTCGGSCDSVFTCGIDTACDLCLTHEGHECNI